MANTQSPHWIAAKAIKDWRRLDVVQSACAGVAMLWESNMPSRCSAPLYRSVDIIRRSVTYYLFVVCHTSYATLFLANHRPPGLRLLLSGHLCPVFVPFYASLRSYSRRFLVFTCFSRLNGSDARRMPSLKSVNSLRTWRTWKPKRQFRTH